MLNVPLLATTATWAPAATCPLGRVTSPATEPPAASTRSMSVVWSSITAAPRLAAVLLAGSNVSTVTLPTGSHRARADHRAVEPAHRALDHPGVAEYHVLGGRGQAGREDARGRRRGDEGLGVVGPERERGHGDGHRRPARVEGGVQAERRVAVGPEGERPPEERVVAAEAHRRAGHGRGLIGG